jgi:hypothetical protein
MFHRWKILILSIILLSSFSSYAEDLIKISHTMHRKLKRNVIMADSTVETKGNKQTLAMSVVGLHPKSCDFALPKLAMYEHYYQFLDLVKKSVYNDATQHIYLKVDHDLLPFPMVLYFKLPRIDKPGHYEFSFNRGFMKGLVGKIHIRKEGKRCLMMAKADWTGPVSKIPDSVFQVFTTTLSRLAAETLFRITRTL